MQREKAIGGLLWMILFSICCFDITSGNIAYHIFYVYLYPFRDKLIKTL